MTVKNYPNWKKIVFNGRTILRSDTMFMSWEQVRSLDNLVVIHTEDRDKTLIVENR